MLGLSHFGQFAISLEWEVTFEPHSREEKADPRLGRIAFSV